MPQKAFASGAAPRRPAFLQEIYLCSRLSALIFALGGSSLFVTLIFGYAYVRVTINNMPKASTQAPYKPWSKWEDFFGKLGES